MVPLIIRLARSTRGATAVEYGLMIALVVIALVGGIASLGSSTHDTWETMKRKVSAVEP